MWKFVSRGIRESLERRVCRTNIYSQSSQDNNAKSEVKSHWTCNHTILTSNFCARTNSSYEFDKSSKTSGPKDDYDSKWNAKHTWTEAVGWSSILAVGWMVCQSLCFRKRLFDKEQSEAHSYKVTRLSEAHISNLLSDILSLHLKKVLPITNCVSNVNINYKEDNGEWKADKQFGPITVEEALREAADSFNKTHELAMGEFELHFGLKAFEEQRYHDAISHFSTGAKLSSPGSLFNLGVCYELGLGTLVDQVKAAKYYSHAARQGHADAMYNLGVFYAQGKGGLSLDIDRARTYFIKAAKLGQIQAQNALDSEMINSQLNEINISQYTNDDKCLINCSKGKNGTNRLLIQLTNNEQPPLETSELSLWKIRQSKNSTDMFLELLNLKESNPVCITG